MNRPEMAEMRVHIDEEATRTSYLLHGISWEKNEEDLRDHPQNTTYL